MKQRLPIHPLNAVICLMFILLASSSAYALRIKDVTHVEGIRDNQLMGYGLVVGLSGTGDGNSTKFPINSLAAFLKRQGLTIDPDNIKADNIAAVVVTADLPPFARSGGRIDVTVSSLGDADSLQGGTLLMTPLKAADGRVYAIAQGAISIGGYSASSGGNTAQKNHPTAGKIPGGGVVELSPPTRLEGRSVINLMLDNPDFTTAKRISQAINTYFKNDECAKTADSSGVIVNIPPRYMDRIADFIAELEMLPVHPDQRARVVIDERTGTVVMGEEVRISTLAIAHGNLSFQITQDNVVSQPSAFGLGETVVVPENTVTTTEEDRKLAVMPEGVSLGEVVQALNSIGVTPRDLIAILQTIKRSGALQAELTIQ